MGWEVTHHAMHVDSELIESARRDEFNSELLCFVGYYYDIRESVQRERFSEGCPERQRLVQILEAMREAAPGIDRRRCELDRRFDWLQWTLGHISGPLGFEDGARLAVFGREKVTEASTSTQGFPIMWNDVETTQFIADWLGEIEVQQVIDACDLKMMKRHGLYKLFEKSNEQHIQDSVAGDFTSLRTFYLEVASLSEAVLVIQD